MTTENIQRIYLDGRHYDLAYRNFTEDVNFWIGEAKRHGGPILELACGTGRVAIPLAREGLEVTGLDLVGSMLEQAQVNSEAEGLEIEWVEADMRYFSIGKKFPLIICPSQSMSRILTVEDFENCLSRVKEHLTPAGVFIMELYNPSMEILGQGEDRAPFLEYEHPDGDGTVWVNVSSTYDTATQIQHLTLHYSLPEVKEQPTEHINIRMYFPQELEALLKYNGFEVVEKYGDFEGKGFESGDNHQIVVCRVKG